MTTTLSTCMSTLSPVPEPFQSVIYSHVPRSVTGRSHGPSHEQPSTTLYYFPTLQTL
jgi:hypothetical protein